VCRCGYTTETFFQDKKLQNQLLKVQAVLSVVAVVAATMREVVANANA
jgi:hypothetical protein